MAVQIKKYNSIISQVNDWSEKYEMDKLINTSSRRLNIVKKLSACSLKEAQDQVTCREQLAELKQVYEVKEDEIGVIKVNSRLVPLSFFISSPCSLAKDLVEHKAFNTIMVCGKQADKVVNLDNISFFREKHFTCFDKVCLMDLPKVKRKRALRVTTEEILPLNAKVLDALKKVYFDYSIGKDYEKEEKDIFLSISKYTKFLENEHFIMMGINRDNKVAAIQELNVGDVSASLVSKNSIINFITEHRDCVRFVTLHNHPSDFMQASREDLRIWKVVSELAMYLGVVVADDFILGKNKYYKRSGILVEE